MRQLSFLLPDEEDSGLLPEELGISPVMPSEGSPVTFSRLAPVTISSTAESTGIASEGIEEIYRIDRLQENGHPFAAGTLFSSPGGHFTYRVIGACCRLFDREELPWPCCRLQWRGKEPSWRRIGRRFVLDMATRHSPSYSVEILELGHHRETIVMTLYAVRLSNTLQNWWYAKPR